MTSYTNHQFYDKNNSNNSLYLLSTYVPTTIPSTYDTFVHLIYETVL